MYTGHVDSEVEVAVGLVVAVRTWNIENLVMDSLYMSLHVLLAGKGFVTPVTLNRYHWFLFRLVTPILLEMALDVFGCFRTIGASGDSLFRVSPTNVPCQVSGDPSCVRAVRAVLDRIFMHKSHMIGNILVYFSTYVTGLVSFLVVSAVNVVLQHVRVLEVLSACGAFLRLVSFHVGCESSKGVQVHPTNAAHCALVNFKLVLFQPLGVNRGEVAALRVTGQGLEGLAGAHVLLLGLAVRDGYGLPAVDAVEGALSGHSFLSNSFLFG